MVIDGAGEKCTSGLRFGTILVSFDRQLHELQEMFIGIYKSY